MALDAAGQQLDELVFSGLIQLNKDLRPVPAIAESWTVENGGKTWRFRIRDNARDQSGEPITAEKMTACLENYRHGKPLSPYIASFPAWTGTEALNNEVLLKLSQPDPYLLRNLSLLRYFRAVNPLSPKDEICTNPKAGDTLIGSGLYRLAESGYDGLFPESELLLLPTTAGPHPLRFIFSIDENSKAIRLLRGDVDVAHYSIQISKTRWFEQKYGDRFRVLAREGVPVTYVAFNLKHPILGKKAVRHAIALSLDRKSIVHYKMFDLDTESGSLLAPMLPESTAVEIPYDPAAAEKELDATGFPRGPDGVRFHITIKTTPIRDGLETNQIFQAMLARIGIQVTLQIVEPAVFFASIRKKNFEMYTSRFIGLSDGSIFYRILRSGRPDNRASYENPEVDRLLDRAMSETDDSARAELMRKVQTIMADDLPYLPLWHSKITDLIRKGLTGLDGPDLSLSSSLVPLSKLR